MNEAHVNRIKDGDLALAMANAEKYDQEQAALIRVRKAALTGLRHASQRRKLSAAETNHMQKAEQLGSDAKQALEDRERVLSLDRSAQKAKLMSQANQLVPDFQSEAGSWPADKTIEWSTDKETKARTLQIRTKENLELGMWFDRRLVLKDGEEPTLLTSLVDAGSPFTKRDGPLTIESELITPTYDVDYKINFAMLESERILDNLILAQARNAHELSR